MSERTRRNPGLDLLRGLSILLVVMHHLGLGNRISLRKTLLGAVLPKWFLNALVYNGTEAVFVFFVLSGFLIASNAMTRWGSLGTLDVRAFYVRRAARILPCLVALVDVLSVLHLLRVQDYVVARADQSLPRAIGAAFGLHLNWYEGHTGYLPASWDVLWSLSIEEVFYLAFPLVCLLLARTPLFVPLLAALWVSLPWTRAALQGNEIWQEKAYLPGMSAIALGVLTALAARRFVPRRAVLGAVFALGTAALVFVLCWEIVLWKPLGNGTMLILTGSAALLCYGFHFRPVALPGTAWLQSMGRLSYEIYLTHMFVVIAVLRLWRALGGDLRWAFLWYVPGVLLSWALGAAVARWISTPAEAWVRARFGVRRETAPAIPC